MKKRLIMVLLLISQFCSISFCSDEKNTTHPIVLIHGLFGFAGELPFNKSYWGDLPQYLRSKNFTVYIASLSPANDSNVRGEQLYEQLKMWGHEKYHLVGHSLGGRDARYILEKYPNIVGSIMTMATPHHGSVIADVVYSTIESIPIISKYIWHCGDIIALGISILSRHYYDIKNQSSDIACHIGLPTREFIFNSFRQIANRAQPKNIFSIPAVMSNTSRICNYLFNGACNLYCEFKKQDLRKAIQCLTTEASQEINRNFPLGITEKESNCTKLFSCGTYGIYKDGSQDAIRLGMKIMSWFFFPDIKNDGVVELTSMQFGRWLDTLAGAHHLVAANNALATFREEEIDWFRNMLLILLKEVSVVER